MHAGLVWKLHRYKTFLCRTRFVSKAGILRHEMMLFRSGVPNPVQDQVYLPEKFLSDFEPVDFPEDDRLANLIIGQCYKDSSGNCVAILEEVYEDPECGRELFVKTDKEIHPLDAFLKNFQHIKNGTH